MRIKPVELNRVAVLPQAMGIVRRPGRDPVRLSTEASERTGPLAWSDGHGVGPSPVVGPARGVALVAMEGSGHSAADRTRVRDGPWAEA